MNLGLYDYMISFRKGTTPDKETQNLIIEDIMRQFQPNNKVKKLQINGIIKYAVQKYDSGYNKGINNIAVLAMSTRTKYIKPIFTTKDSIRTQLMMRMEKEDCIHIIITFLVDTEDDKMVTVVNCIPFFNEPNKVVDIWTRIVPHTTYRKETIPNELFVFIDNNCIMTTYNYLELTAAEEAAIKKKPVDAKEEEFPKAIPDRVTTTALYSDIKEYLRYNCSKHKVDLMGISNTLNIKLYKFDAPSKMHLSELMTVVKYFEDLNKKRG